MTYDDVDHDDPDLAEESRQAGRASDPTLVVTCASLPPVPTEDEGPPGGSHCGIGGSGAAAAEAQSSNPLYKCSLS